jgi:hypothetical protein
MIARELILDKIQNAKIYLENLDSLGYSFITTNEIFISINQPIEDMVLTLIHETLHTILNYHSLGLSKKQLDLKIEKDAQFVYLNYPLIRYHARRKIIESDWPQNTQMFLPFDRPLSMGIYSIQ